MGDYYAPDFEAEAEAEAGAEAGAAARVEGRAALSQEAEAAAAAEAEAVDAWAETALAGTGARQDEEGEEGEEVEEVISIHLEINIKGKGGPVVVTEGDDLGQAARDFCAEHGLAPSLAGKLQQHFASALEAESKAHRVRVREAQRAQQQALNEARAKTAEAAEHVRREAEEEQAHAKVATKDKPSKHGPAKDRSEAALLAAFREAALVQLGGGEDESKQAFEALAVAASAAAPDEGAAGAKRASRLPSVPREALARFAEEVLGETLTDDLRLMLHAQVDVDGDGRIALKDWLRFLAGEARGKAK
jgi:hypothetical protein